MTGYLFVAVAVLMAAAGLRVRHRLRHQRPPSAFRVPAFVGHPKATRAPDLRSLSGVGFLQREVVRAALADMGVAIGRPAIG